MTPEDRSKLEIPELGSSDGPLPGEVPTKRIKVVVLASEEKVENEDIVSNLEQKQMNKF